MRIRLLSFLLLMGLAGCPAPEPEPEPGPGVQGWDVEDGPRAEEPKPTAPAAPSLDQIKLPDKVRPPLHRSLGRLLLA